MSSTSTVHVKKRLNIRPPPCRLYRQSLPMEILRREKKGEKALFAVLHIQWLLQQRVRVRSRQELYICTSRKRKASLLTLLLFLVPYPSRTISLINAADTSVRETLHYGGITDKMHVAVFSSANDVKVSVVVAERILDCATAARAGFIALRSRRDLKRKDFIKERKKEKILQREREGERGRMWSWVRAKGFRYHMEIFFKCIILECFRVK